jgi:hypothetical protein
MEGSCEYIEYVVAGSRRDGPPAWGLGGGLTTPHRKTSICYEYHRASGMTQAPKNGKRVLRRIRGPNSDEVTGE